MRLLHLTLTGLCMVLTASIAMAKDKKPEKQMDMQARPECAGGPTSDSLVPSVGSGRAARRRVWGGRPGWAWTSSASRAGSLILLRTVS